MVVISNPNRREVLGEGICGRVMIIMEEVSEFVIGLF